MGRQQHLKMKNSQLQLMEELHCSWERNWKMFIWIISINIWEINIEYKCELAGLSLSCSQRKEDKKVLDNKIFTEEWLFKVAFRCLLVQK